MCACYNKTAAAERKSACDGLCAQFFPGISSCAEPDYGYMVSLAGNCEVLIEAPEIGIFMAIMESESVGGRCEAKGTIYKNMNDEVCDNAHMTAVVEGITEKCIDFNGGSARLVQC